jgi:hypothetical protein
MDPPQEGITWIQLHRSVLALESMDLARMARLCLLQICDARLQLASCALALGNAVLEGAQFIVEHFFARPLA